MMLVLALPLAAQARPSVWEALPLEQEPTTMTMAEDGRTIYVAHEGANRITAVDVVSGKVVSAFDCPSPRHLLCRGEWVFAACFQEGSVRQFTRKDGQHVKTVKVARAPHYLSAAWGNAFDGKLLVTCLGEKGPHPYLVDMTAAKATPAPGPSKVGEFLPDGKAVQLDEGIYDPGSFGRKGRFRYIIKSSARFRVGATGARFGRDKIVCPGNPRAKLNAWVRPYKISTYGPRTVVLPDAVGGRFAVVDDAVLLLRRAMDNKNVAAVAIDVPQWLVDVCKTTSSGENGYWQTLPDTSRIYHVPCASTLGDGFYAFMLSRPRLSMPPRQDKPVLYRLAGPFALPRDGLDEMLPMKLEETERVTGMSLSENGRHLLVSHEKANKISVIDVKTCRPVASVTIPSPRLILCRGGKVYVASSEGGGITVVDPVGWKAVGMLRTGDRKVLWMDTLAREFDGKIALVLAPGGGAELDVTTGNVTPSERLLMTYGSPAVPGLRFQDNLVGWAGAKSDERSKMRKHPVWQFIPDARAPVVYSISRWRVAWHRPGADMSVIGDRTAIMGWDMKCQWSPAMPPQAVTLDGRLYLFSADATSPKPQIRRYVTIAPGGASSSVASAGGASDLPTATGVLSTVPTAGRVSGFTITEDGRHLVVAQAAEDRLGVWEIATGRFVTALKVAQPGPMLSRRGQLFACSAADGTLSVFDTADWTLKDNVKVGSKYVVALSAPGGSYFRGKLLAVANQGAGIPVADRRQNDRWETEIFLVDVQRDSARKLPLEGRHINAAISDYTGQYVLLAGPEMMVTWKDFEAGKLDRRGKSFHVDSRMFQVANPRFWFRDGGGHTMSVGTPPQPFASPVTGQIMPDIMGKYAATVGISGYSSKRDCLVKIHTLDAEMAILGSAKFQVEEDLHLSSGRCVRADRSVCVFAIDSKRNLLRLVRVDVGGSVSPVPSDSVATKDGQFPAKVLPGQALALKLPSPGAGAVFKLLRSPAGATISKDGTIRWTPTKGQSGKQEFKVRAQRGGEIYFSRYSTVVAAGAAAEDLKPIYVLTDECRFTPGSDGKSVLALAGQELIVLDARGAVRSRHELSVTCQGLLDAGTFYAAYSENRVLLLDKQTLKTVGTVDLGTPVADLAGHPTHSFLYVAVTDSKGGNVVTKHRVMAIEIASRKAALMPRIYGQRLAMDASGTYLYASLKAVYKRGYAIDWDFDDIVPVYGGFNLLTCYKITGSSPLFASANFKMAVDSPLLTPSPDARQLLCFGTTGRRVQLLNAADVSRSLLVTDLRGRVTSAAFHPRLPLLAAASEGKVRLLGLPDATEQFARLDVSGFTSVQSVCFTPDGRSLLAMGRSRDRKQMIAVLPLRLAPAEQAALAMAPPKPSPAAMPVDTSAADPPVEIAAVPAGALAALSRPPLRNPLKPKDIARAFNDTVVVVQTPTSAGTGFFVGEGGYVLTSARVLSALGEPVVKYRLMKAGKLETVRARARVVRVDEANGLALLRIAIAHRPPVVSLGNSRLVEAGEEVVVIGHPGLDQDTLNHTLTTGVVSNPRQLVEKREYVQTNAAINPGSSGSPLFDSRGNVIGLVMLKGKIEGAGFAVPADALKTFLQSCTRKAGS